MLQFRKSVWDPLDVHIFMVALTENQLFYAFLNTYIQYEMGRLA